jgi:hypothetical protein
MKKTAALLIVITTLCPGLAAETLWDPGFEGYLKKPRLLREGQTVIITLDTETALSFSASKTGDKEVVFEFSGGEGGNPFAFLPDVKSGDRKDIEGEEDLSLKGSLAARVGEQRERGLYYIQGSRTAQIQGAVQALTVTGWLDSSLLTDGRTFPFGLLQDGKLVFRSFLQSDTPILTEEDIARGIEEAEETAENTADPEEAAAATEEPAGKGLSLTEEKKRELLLGYINQFLDLVFQD